jgi:hypothetical protein
MRTFRQIRRAIAAVLLVLLLPGCYHWAALPISPDDPASSVEGLHSVRVKTTAGSRFELRAPTVRGDTLVGSRDESLVTILISNLSRVERRKVAPGRTLVLFALTFVVAAAAAAGGDWCFGQPSC